MGRKLFSHLTLKIIFHYLWLPFLLLKKTGVSVNVGPLWEICLFFLTTFRVFSLFLVVSIFLMPCQALFSYLFIPYLWFSRLPEFADWCIPPISTLLHSSYGLLEFWLNRCPISTHSPHLVTAPLSQSLFLILLLSLCEPPSF